MGIPASNVEEGEELGGGSRSTARTKCVLNVCVSLSVCVCARGRVCVKQLSRSARLSQNHWIFKKKEKRKRGARTRRRGVDQSPCSPVFSFRSFSPQVESRVHKRAVCIRTAGCYGQSGNGGQGTDRGRGSRPADPRHPRCAELPSAERLVAHRASR